jgi:hypothetical protein
MNKHHTVKELCNELNIPQTKYGSFKGWLYKNRELLDPRVNGSRLLYNIDSVRAFYPAYSPRRNPKATTNVSRHQLAKALWYARFMLKRAHRAYLSSAECSLGHELIKADMRRYTERCEHYYEGCNRAYKLATVCLTIAVIIAYIVLFLTYFT